jgi:peroxiredoxin
MKYYLFIYSASLILACLVSSLGADEPKPQTPADEFRAMTAKYHQAQEEYKKAYQSAKTAAEKRKIEDDLGLLSTRRKYAGEFFRFIERHPKDGAAVDAYLWLLTEWPGLELEKANRVIGDNQADSERMEQICRWLADHESFSSIPLLWRIVKKNSHPEIQGLARYSLARQLKLISESAADGFSWVYPWKDPDTVAKSPATELRTFDLWGLPDLDPAGESAATAVRLLEEVVGKYDQVKFGTSTLGKVAQPDLLELRRLSVGKIAPEIEGKDLNGKPMKLSDFRGKVVLLHFWDATTLSDMSRVRRMARMFNDKPFVILGINTDKNRERINEAIELQEITWRSWSDEAPYSPISSSWNVKTRPAMYLLDEKGTIRFKGKSLEGFTRGYDRDGSNRQDYRLEGAVKQLLWGEPEISEIIRKLGK